MNYNEFIENKKTSIVNKSINVSESDLYDSLYDFQKAIVKWALKKGKSAIFSMTGTGKTWMLLEFARQVHKNTGDNVIIISPLAVSEQTIEIGKRMGVFVSNHRKKEIGNIRIVNYEYIDHIDFTHFNCVILDESSILKNFSGKIRNSIIENFKNYDFKLCLSATPAPNDFMELGNHSEFLDVMSYREMLAMFFIHDSKNTKKWRLKKHAHSKFWEWISGWSVIVDNPNRIGFNQVNFALPKLNIHKIEIETDHIMNDEKRVFFSKQAIDLSDRKKVRRIIMNDKIDYIADMINASDDTFIVWCELNIESELLAKKVNDCVEVSGSHSNDYKEKAMLDFSNNKIKCLVTKPKIAGFGMNWQHCHKMIFVGVTDSFEQYFQAIRRCYRFGQKNDVDVYILTSYLEGDVVRNLNRKQKQAKEMLRELTLNTEKYLIEKFTDNNKKNKIKYNVQEIIIPEWLKKGEKK